MFILNLKRNGIINSMNCLALKRSECRVLAVVEQSHPDCPHIITLAEYSNENRASKEFDKLVEAIRLNKKYYEMQEE